MHIKRRTLVGAFMLSGITVYILPKKITKSVHDNYQDLTSIIQDETALRRDVMDQITTSLSESVRAVQREIEESKKKLLEELDDKLATIHYEHAPETQVHEAAQLTAASLQEVAQLRKRAIEKIRAIFEQYDQQLVATLEEKRLGYLSKLDGLDNDWRVFFEKQALEVMAYLQSYLEKDPSNEMLSAFLTQRQSILDAINKIKKPTDKYYRSVYYKVLLFRNLRNAHKKGLRMLSVPQGPLRDRAEVALLYELSDLLKFRAGISPIAYLADRDIERAIKRVLVIEAKESEILHMNERINGLTAQLAALELQLSKTTSEKTEIDKKMEKLSNDIASLTESKEKEVAEFKQKIDRIKTENTTLEATLETAKKDLKTATDEFAHARSKNIPDDATIRSFEQKIKNLSKLLQESETRSTLLDEYANRLEQEVIFILESQKASSSKKEQVASLDSAVMRSLETELNAMLKR